jgi:hypothetical protein
MNCMMLATLLAAASATAPAPKKPAAPPTAQPAALDVVPAFIGACMNPGPDADKIRAVVVKAGGKPAQENAAAGNGAPAPVQAYIFQNGGLPYSVVFDRSGTCSVVSGRVDVDASKSSLDRLVIGSSKVFDISQTDAKPHVEGETVLVEYMLASKHNNGGLRLTLSRVTRNGQRPSVFLTRRIIATK